MPRAVNSEQLGVPSEPSVHVATVVHGQLEGRRTRVDQPWAGQLAEVDVPDACTRDVDVELTATRWVTVRVTSRCSPGASSKLSTSMFAQGVAESSSGPRNRVVPSSVDGEIGELCIDRERGAAEVVDPQLMPRRTGLVLHLEYRRAQPQRDLGPLSILWISSLRR